MNQDGVFTYTTDAPPKINKPHQDFLPLYNDQNPMLALVQPEIDFTKPGTDLAAVSNLAQQLLKTMTQYHGAGLAAPQCGIAARLFVMSGGIVCINPVVVESSKETSHQKEGCLSFPGLILPVTRSVTARFKYTDETGKRIDVTWTGATARVALHEMDHLNGIVFTKRVGTVTLQMAKKKRQKLFKKIQNVADFKARQQQRKEHPHSAPSHAVPGKVPVSSGLLQTHRES